MVKRAEKVAQQARMAIERWRQWFKYNIDQYHNTFTFTMGQQWNEEERDMLQSFKKVPLQFNKLAALVNTLLGEQQQNTPQLEVTPASNCDEQTAQLREIVVKDIMLSDEAKTVYQVAAMQSFVGGFGGYIIDTEYKNNASFELEIVYRYINDATKFYWDIGAKTVNKTDGMRAGYVTRMSRRKFRSLYGKKIEQNIYKDSSITASQEEIALATQPGKNDETDFFNWADDDSITIIDDYYRKYENVKLYRLSNGKEVLQEELDIIIDRSLKIYQQMQQQQNLMGEYSGFEEELENPYEEQPEMVEESVQVEQIPERIMLYDEGEVIRIEDYRMIKKSKIIHRKIAGDYILEESVFPADDLPIVFVDQESYFEKTGKQVCRPFIVDAIDSQRYLNYLGTQAAYLLKISRYDQFIAPRKSIAANDTQAVWRDPMNVQGALVYDETPSGARPEQLRPPELPVSLTQQYQKTVEDLYTCTGLYPSRLGQQGNEISGAAIDARTRQGSYSTYIAFNSINRAITAGGTIVNQMIPHVYDTMRVISLMTPDKGRQNITINEQSDEYGMMVKNDLRKGTFVVRLKAGPSYEGQKAEALNSLNMVLQANPSLLNMFADLYAENLPLANNLEIKNRLKTIVPPEVLEAGKTGQMPQKNQMPNAQDQAAMAAIQAEQQKLKLKEEELKIKMAEVQAKIEQKEIELEIKRMEALSELEGQKLRYLAETDRTRSDNAISHADNMTKIILHKEI